MLTNILRFEDLARNRWRSLSARLARLRTGAILTLCTALFLLVVCWPWIVITVPAGHVAVRWWRFFGGTDISQIYGEGAHLDFPWDQMPIYDARIQEINRNFDVLTSDGMMMTVNIAMRFRLNPATVGLLHKNVGPNYIETLIMPSIGSYARMKFAQYSAEDVYGARRASIQDEIREAVIKDLAPHVAPGQAPVSPWLFVEDVLIRSMKFPPEVAAAINRKMEQYEVKQEYAYRLERERLESERKQVEADGIARFQKTVGAGISENYLRWKGIDATLALAQSPNAKVVVIGTPRDGMPLILGGGENALPLPARSVPPAGAGHAQTGQNTPPADERNRHNNSPPASYDRQASKMGSK